MLEAVILFAVAAAVLTVTPGLDTVLVLRTSLAEGARPAFLAGLGIATGVLAWGLLVALGLGALLTTSEAAYHALRVVGAAYLIWIGLRLLRTPRRALGAASGTSGQRQDAAQTWFMRGLLTNLLNPKVGLFYLTFLPQFIPAGASVALTSGLLALVHAAESVLWFALLSALAGPLGGWLHQPGRIAAIDRLTGGLFVAFGLRLAWQD
ncbi:MULTISPECIES: LysE family translocator [Gulbenkiania]|uniref:Threonine/homoserine/homoserine lactone efflux protein n=2 Tax=Gulbenkiania TaxID=397456 RepID=A0A0K6H364_9NEIS|nr:MULTISPECIES: LysE family translocator [Gulbenkiania]TCW30253.1 threonine/homoserine/homoserine lactone efflux protein [Gulbenkiania mobilis]CUA85437.1 Threonine/homoserine/homoserine lactone efflux protein [Gulbenkiania indica]